MHKFRHDFQDCLNLLFLKFGGWRYSTLPSAIPSFFSVWFWSYSVKSVSDNFESDNIERDILLYGDSRFDTNKNKLILEAAISYIKNTERFSGSLYIHEKPTTD